MPALRAVGQWLAAVVGLPLQLLLFVLVALFALRVAGLSFEDFSQLLPSG